MSILMDYIEHIEDISLWAMDETGKFLESNNYRSWSPKGVPKVIEKNGSHAGVNIIGATSITKVYNFIYKAYSKYDTTICSSHIVNFLEYLIQYDKSKGNNLSIVVMDNASIHRAKEVREFAMNHKEELIIIYQPKYSPELNPQENMWYWMKHDMAKSSAFKNVVELLNVLEKFSSKANDHPDDIKRMVDARKFYKLVSSQ